MVFRKEKAQGGYQRLQFIVFCDENRTWGKGIDNLRLNTKHLVYGNEMIGSTNSDTTQPLMNLTPTLGNI